MYNHISRLWPKSRLCGFILCLSLICIPAGAVQSFSDADYENALTAAREVHQQGDYPDSLNLSAEKTKPDDEDPTNSSDLRMIEASRIAPWILTVIAILLLIALLPSLSLERLTEAQRRDDVPDDTSEDARKPNTPPAWVQGNPDDLAKAGMWNEAVAALLYRSLLLTGWRSEGRDASLTAREVLKRLSRDDPRLPHLKRILLAAERVRFGGMTATSNLYQKTLQVFQMLKPKGGH